jgi:hypothetical protein
MQCGKPFFSNTHQNGEWTETITRQNEIELAMFDIEEEEINAALKRVLILLDQVNDLSKSAK